MGIHALKMPYDVASDDNDDLRHIEGIQYQPCLRGCMQQRGMSDDARDFKLLPECNAEPVFAPREGRSLRHR